VPTRRRGRTAEFPRLLAGLLCLDFVNTIEDPFGAAEDFLHGYEDLVRWSRHSGTLEAGEAERLRVLASTRPSDAGVAFAEALRLRQSLERIFRAVAAGRPAPVDEVRWLQGRWAKALSAAALAPAGSSLRWSWEGVSDLRLPLWLVVESAIEVLTRGDLRRVKQCPGADDCGWLFYDASRNASRRWCSMEGCGSRVKMRRHYARQKQRPLPRQGQ
jgi:predicted RNA-binding Zn ribbon-like protein